MVVFYLIFIIVVILFIRLWRKYSELCDELNNLRRKYQRKRDNRGRFIKNKYYD